MYHNRGQNTKFSAEIFLALSKRKLWILNKKMGKEYDFGRIFRAGYGFSVVTATLPIAVLTVRLRAFSFSRRYPPG